MCYNAGEGVRRGSTFSLELPFSSLASDGEKLWESSGGCLAGWSGLSGEASPQPVSVQEMICSGAWRYLA